MPLFTIDQIKQAAQLVYTQMPPTPQYNWPIISKDIGADVWVKHENHTPTGAFKVRGGITFIDWIKRTQPKTTGICTATRGNHGQSQTRAAIAAGLSAQIYVPFGNSVEKNAAMRAFGGEVIEFGEDFDVARMEAIRVAEEQGLAVVPPFHIELLRGVASYAYELFSNVPNLDTVYVPIGCGSGICSIISVRDAMGVKTKVVGVVSTEAQTAKLSFEAGRLVETNTANTFADGMAVRIPVADAYDIYANGAERIVSVTEDEVAKAIRLYYTATHNLAEGAGAATLAALIQERDKMQGKRIGVILTGGNIDMDMFKTVMRGDVPKV
ncbi:MAG: threonine dehydratase [Amylibacter sp.]